MDTPGHDKIEITIQNQKSISRDICDVECFVNTFITYMNKTKSKKKSCVK